MITKHPLPALQAIDLHASFGEETAGASAWRVIDSYGREKLDSTVWNAGKIAYDFLKDNCADATSDDGYRTWTESAKSFLQDDFYPDLIKKIADKRIDLNQGSLEDFKEAWTEYDWVEKLSVFLQIIDKLKTSSQRSADLGFYKSYLACALLWRIDDAVISVFCDGRGLTENLVDIIQFRDRLTTELQHEQDVASAIGAARKEIGKAGAAARLAKDPKQAAKTVVRECWEAWQAEPSRYKGVAAFARDMLQKFESLESQPVIERWCREWKNAIVTQPAK